MPADALDAAIALRELLPVVREDWVSETHVLEVDCGEDGGARAIAVGRYGYVRANGEFIEAPLLELVPHFTTRVDDALKFKASVFGACLRLAITEENYVDWGADYSVGLLDKRSNVIHAYRACAARHSWSDTGRHASGTGARTAAFRGWGE